MKSRSIIFFYPSFEDGGATKNLINLINYFTKKKINILLITNKKNIKELNYNKYLNYKTCKKLHLFFFIPFRWNIALSAMLNLFLYLYTSNKNDFILSMQSHIPAIIVSKIFGKKIIIRNSEEPLGATLYADNRLLAFIILFLKFLFYNFSDKIIAISKKSEESLKKIVIFKSKIKLIYNPYIKKINKKKLIKHKYFTIMTAGRLAHQKNIIPIIKSINNLIKKDYKIIFKIIGKGKGKKIIKKNIKKNKQIILKNWQKNIEKEFLTTDLYILNSFYEGLPNTLIDAVNFEIPSISTNVSGAKDILCNGQGGYIIPINNQKYLENTIEYVINNYSKAKKKIKFAKKNIRRFGPMNLEKFYLEIINT